MATFKPTNANLEFEANRIEEHAEASLRAWIILGEVDKYGRSMERVRKLRHAITIKGLRARADYLGNCNIERL